MNILMMLAILIIVTLVIISVIYMIKNYKLIKEIENSLDKRKNPPPPKL